MDTLLLDFCSETEAPIEPSPGQQMTDPVMDMFF